MVILRKHLTKSRGRNYASVAGKNTMLFEMRRSKENSIDLIKKILCLHHNPAGLRAIKEQNETFVTKSCKELSENRRVIGREESFSSVMAEVRY